MKALAARDTARIVDIGAALATMRIGGPSSVDEVLPAVRRLLDVDNVTVYALAEEERGYGFERWHHDGSSRSLEPQMRRVFASAPRDIVFYNPTCPDPSIRNRVLEATAWIDRKTPGTWLSSQICRDVFTPLGLQHHKQLRALLCDGSELLGWFGALTSGPIAPHQQRLLSELVPAMRQRLSIERRLALAPGNSRALEVALDRIGAPAFVVGAHGCVFEANAAARVLLDTRRGEVVTAIADARARRANAMRVELTPITANGAPDAWLAIVRVEAADTRSACAVAAAASRWSLTPRQRTVLEHLAQGHANATIAALMDISVRAVELHVTALLDRVGVDGRSALVARVLAQP